MKINFALPIVAEEGRIFNAMKITTSISSALLFFCPIDADISQALFYFCKKSIIIACDFGWVLRTDPPILCF